MSSAGIGTTSETSAETGNFGENRKCVKIGFQKTTILSLGTSMMPSSSESKNKKAKKRPAPEKKCQMSWLSYMSRKMHSGKKKNVNDINYLKHFFKFQ